MITVGRLTIQSNNSKIGIIFNEILEDDDVITWEDKFGRKFKLIPVTNENIKFPFIIEPIFEEFKK